jgi:hypothetical protein
MDSANRGFVALGSRTRAATIAVACASALCIVTNVLGIAFRDSIETHAINPVTALLFLADVAVFLLAYVVAVVLFSVWLHRAVRNLAGLGRTETKYSPTAAVGSFFIPFVNIVRPWRVMKELWLASEPGAPADGSKWQKSGTGTPLLETWWGFFIASCGVKWWTPHSLRAFAGLVSAGLVTIAGIHCVRLMRDIALRQNAIAARLGFRSDEPYR